MFTCDVRPPPHARQPSLLVVDDHRDSARILARVLGLYGYDVTTANGRDEALEACGHEAFDLLSTDIELGEARDGVQLFGELQLAHGIKGIAYSGYGEAENVARAMDAGFSDYIMKPVSIQAILGSIGKVLGVTPTRLSPMPGPSPVKAA
jgi:DNA-binding NtrC family response regulator